MAHFAWLARHGPWIHPAAVALGLLWQDLAAIARPFLPVTVLMMLTLLLTRLNISQAFAHIRRPRLILAALAWSLILIPLLMNVVLWLWPVSDGLRLALTIYASSPPNFSTAALAWMFGLDGNLAVVFTLGAIALHPVVTPAFTELFASNIVELSAMQLAARLAGLIGAAVVLAAILRHTIPRRHLDEGHALFDAAHILIMVAFAVALMDGIPARIAAQPVFAVQLIALSFALHIVINALSYAFWRVFDGI